MIFQRLDQFVHRPDGLIARFMTETQTQVDALDKLSSRLTAAIKRSDAYVDQLMEMKQLAWNVRNSAGDASVVISNIMAGQPVEGLLNMPGFQLRNIGPDNDALSGPLSEGVLEGIEHAFADRLSLKLEYLHYDLGTANYLVTVVAGGPPQQPAVWNASSKVSGDIVRVGLNYRFYP